VNRRTFCRAGAGLAGATALCGVGTLAGADRAASHVGTVDTRGHLVADRQWDIWNGGRWQWVYADGHGERDYSVEGSIPGLSVRRDREGERPAFTAEETPEELVVFVPGWGDRSRAARARDRFVAGLVAGGYEAPVVEFDWSSAAGPSEVGDFDATLADIGTDFDEDLRTDVARETGQKLAAFVRDFRAYNEETDLRVVAYDAGGIVALSAVQNLHEGGGSTDALASLDMVGSAAPGTRVGREQGNGVALARVTVETNNFFSRNDEFLAAYADEADSMFDDVDPLGRNGIDSTAVQPRNYYDRGVHRRVDGHGDYFDADGDGGVFGPLLAAWRQPERRTAEDGPTHVGSVWTRGHFEVEWGVDFWNGGFRQVELAENHGKHDYSIQGSVPGLTVESDPKYRRPTFSEREGAEAPDEMVVVAHGWGIRDELADRTWELLVAGLREEEYSAVPVVAFDWSTLAGGGGHDLGYKADFRQGDDIARRSGHKLAQFLRDFREFFPETDLRLVGHSSGSRVVLSATRILHEEDRLEDALASVDVFGAAVHDESVGLDDKYGEAIASVTGQTNSYYTANDETLADLPLLWFGNGALGYEGADPDATPPDNYEEFDVSDRVDGHKQYFDLQPGKGCSGTVVEEWREGGEGGDDGERTPATRTTTESGSLRGPGRLDRYVYDPLLDETESVELSVEGPRRGRGAGADFDMYVTLDGRTPSPREFDRRSTTDGAETMTLEGDSADTSVGICVHYAAGTDRSSYDLTITEEGYELAADATDGDDAGGEGPTSPRRPVPPRSPGGGRDRRRLADREDEDRRRRR
jgi:thioesterase domain-containing protein